MINKETEDMDSSIGQLNLIDIYKTFHPTTKYTFFSSAYETFSRVNTH